MEERRFDALTRTLGAATTRRQVLKGVLGGALALLAGRSLGAPGAAAASCSVAHCKEAATRELFLYENTTCNNLCHDRTMFVACFGCRMTANRLYNQWLKDCENGDGCLSVAGEVCCGGVCANVGSDPNNCGACGHACPPGNDCVHGQCQCGQHGIVCDGQCVDPRIDAKHCGSCDHACGTCETCENGQCVAVECGDGKICCQDQCVDLCSGEPPDPTTCQCDACQGIECGVCSVCVNGTCQPAMDGADCGGGYICQQGRCVNPCPDECTVYQNGQCVAAPNGTSCGGGASTCCNGACSVFPGQPCCAEGSDPCGSSLCCDSGTFCSEYGNNQFTCCAGDVLPDGTCCQPDEDPLQCSYADGTVTYVCCGAAAHGYNECHCCQPDCCDNVTCGTGPIQG